MSYWGDLIKRYRQLHGLTQAAFAEALGVELTTVSRWERNFYAPDLAMQRQLRDLIMRSCVISDRIVMHQVQSAMSILKLANRSGQNQAVSNPAALLHGVKSEHLQKFNYTPMHTEILAYQWQLARELGFFRGEVASLHVINSWRPVCGGPMRYCEANWTPTFLSDGEIMLLSEFRDLDEEAFSHVPEEKRISAVMVEELLG
ncbi:MAG: helix-turn-helix transcriptional regulator [Novosphingobium sp.]|nr:helix-turn-helix transcriptional regulator [Novosphingobium sp.]